MTDTIYAWSQTAASNNASDATINWAEFQNPSTVNNSARAMMARVSELLADLAPTRTSTGSNNAYSVTSAAAGSVLRNGEQISFLPNHSNTASCTLNVDGRGARPWRPKPGTSFVSNNIIAGVPVTASYSLLDDAWYTAGGYYVSALASGVALQSITARLPQIGDMVVSMDSAPGAGRIRLTEITSSHIKATWPELNAWLSARSYPWGSTASHFNLPPAAGYVLRFAGTSAAIDTGGPRAAGSVQADAVLTHTHTVTGTGFTDTTGAHAHVLSGNVYDGGNGFAGYPGFDGSGQQANIINTTQTAGAHAHNVTIGGTALAQAGGATENRVKNVAFHIDVIASTAQAAAQVAIFGFPLQWDTGTTAANPGAGRVRGNNATLASITALYVSTSDGWGVNIAGILTGLTTGNAIHLSKVGAQANRITATMSGPPSAAVGYVVVPVTIDVAAGALAANDQLALEYSKGGTGTPGLNGMDSGIRWTFDAVPTMADPGIGEIRVNSATYAAATALAISALTAEPGNPDFSDWLTTWDDSTTESDRGQITLRTATSQVVFSVTGSVTDNTSWIQVPVAHVAGAGTLSGTVHVSFSRSGNAGGVETPLYQAIQALVANPNFDLSPGSYLLDNIASGFNGSATTFNLSLTGVPKIPATAAQLIVHVGNSYQTPGVSYTVSGSSISFAMPPAAGLICAIVLVQLDTTDQGPQSLDDILDSSTRLAMTPAERTRLALTSVVDIRDFAVDLTGVTDSTTALEQAVLAARTSTGVVFIPPGVVRLTRGIDLQSVRLVGAGPGKLRTQIETLLLFTGTGARSHTIANCGSTVIANPSIGEAHLADSGTRGNSYRTLDLTTPFSAAVRVGTGGGVEKLAIVADFDGLSGYNGADARMAADWDVGLWCHDALGGYHRDVNVNGHWRRAGCLLSAETANTGADESLFDNCQFEGFRGVAIRSPNPASGTWGFAGTAFRHCKIRDLFHQSRHFATSSALAVPFASPSAAIEVDGGTMRGIRFIGCTIHAREALAIYGRCSEIELNYCYYEAKAAQVSGAWLSTTGCHVVATANATSILHNDLTKFGADLSGSTATPYKRDSSVTRFTAAGAFNPTSARDDEYERPLSGLSVGFRMRSGGDFRVWNSNLNYRFRVDEEGNTEANGRVTGRSFEGQQIIIVDDAVATITPPSSGGLLLIQQQHPSFPTTTRYALLSIDSGSTPAMTTVSIGSGMVNGGVAATPPTGTTGADGVATVTVAAGAVYVENRWGASNQICATWLGGYV